MRTNFKQTQKTTLTAILAAIILLMAFTPLGYLRVGPVSITFLAIPVVIGGITLGSVRGGFLGAVFGATSLTQCFLGDAFGAALFAINPVATVTACLIPRVLIGVVSGLLFPLLFTQDKTGVASFVITSVAGVLTNTILFIGMVVGFFKDTFFGGSPFFVIFLSFFTLNVALELLVGVVISTALSAVVLRQMRI